MDIVGWLNDITNGNLLLWKVVLATVVFALAGLQVAMAARFWGVAPAIPDLGRSGGEGAPDQRTGGIDPGHGGGLHLPHRSRRSDVAHPGPAPLALRHARLHRADGQVRGAQGGEAGGQVPPGHRIVAVPDLRCDLGDQRRGLRQREVTAMRRVSRVTALAGAIVLGSGGPLALAPVAAGAATAQAQAARIVDFDFAPNQLTVNVGTTVTWTNDGGRPHTVTDRGGTFDTDPIAPGATGEVTFSTPGTYRFFCRINPSRMNGLLTVEGDAALPTRRVEALDPAIEGAALSFSPADLSVPAGATIVFANVGGKPHTLTADDGSFDSGVVTPGPEGGRFAGSNATVTVSQPGTIPFHCEVHPAAMKGTLTVTGEARAGPSPPSNAPKTVDVAVRDFEFDAGQVSVAPGGEVTWTNNGDAPHTATFDDEALDTGTIDPGGEGSLTAPLDPGSYSYRCTIHPARMRGVLVVLGENADDPAADPAVAAAGGPPPVAVGGGGPGGGVSGLVLATGVIGGFLGGFGIAAFLLGRKKKEPPPPKPPASAAVAA